MSQGPKIPSLNWLRVFEAAARSGSFSKAAVVLNMSPSAVSQQISALEGHLKRPLFIRGPRSVTLTEEGARFLPSVQLALETAEGAAATIRGRGADNHIALSCNSLLAEGWLAPRLEVFQKSYPDLTISVHCQDAMSGSAPPEVDIALLYGHSYSDWEKAKLLYGEMLYPVAKPELAERIQSPKDLSKYNLIEVLGHSRAWPSVFAALSLDEEDVRIGLFSNSTAVALAFAGAGKGVALARSPSSDWLLERYGLVSCLEMEPVQSESGYLLSMRPGARNRPALRLFHDWLLEEVESADL